VRLAFADLPNFMRVYSSLCDNLNEGRLAELIEVPLEWDGGDYSAAMGWSDFPIKHWLEFVIYVRDQSEVLTDPSRCTRAIFTIVKDASAKLGIPSKSELNAYKPIEVCPFRFTIIFSQIRQSLCHSFSPSVCLCV
jgi:hypothetical protein